MRKWDDEEKRNIYYDIYGKEYPDPMDGPDDLIGAINESSGVYDGTLDRWLERNDLAAAEAAERDNVFRYGCAWLFVGAIVIGAVLALLGGG